ncbi:MAG: hypothetical protein ACR2QF_11860 [Geminicoccaceae bacterium]
MASKVGVWNQALQRLGTRRVDTDTEETAEAEALIAVWDEARLYVLEQYPWSFARVVDQLAQVLPAPETVWTYFYQLPSDIVHILRVSDGTDNFEWSVGKSVPYERQFDDRIAADAEEAYLYYIRDVDDMNLWIPSARSALAWRLAYEVGPRLVESAAKWERADREYLKGVEIAKSQDSARSRAFRINETPHVTARRSAVG